MLETRLLVTGAPVNNTPVPKSSSNFSPMYMDQHDSKRMQAADTSSRALTLGRKCSMLLLQCSLSVREIANDTARL